MIDEQNEPTADELPEQPKRTVRKLGLAAALAIIPIGAFGAIKHLEQKDHEKEEKTRKGYQLDTEKFRQVDPKLIKYRELGALNPGMAMPLAIAADGGGNVLVAGKGAVNRLSATGSVLGTFPIAGLPTCLTADAAGNTYVGFADHVEVYDGGGKLAASWKGLGESAHVVSITVTDKEVYLGDAGRRVVVRCDLAGNPINEIGRRDEARGIPGIVAPSPHLDVAVRDGHVWVANPGKHRVEAYTPAGQLERYWGASGAGIEEFFGCCNPTDFAMLADGSFVTSEKGIARIKKYDAEGVFQSVVAGPDAFGDNMVGLDIATDPAGRVLVLERGTKTVRVFVPIDGGPK